MLFPYIERTCSYVYGQINVLFYSERLVNRDLDKVMDCFRTATDGFQNAQTLNSFEVFLEEQGNTTEALNYLKITALRDDGTSLIHL
jgi:hypothetical protein